MRVGELSSTSTAAIAASIFVSPFMDHMVSPTSSSQSNLLKHLGGMGPYVQGSGVGIPASFEWNVKPDKVFIFARHGERYPTKPVARRLKGVFDKLKLAATTMLEVVDGNADEEKNGSNDDEKRIEGPLHFVKDWEFFIPGPDWLGMETLYGDFNGFQTMFDFGKSVKVKYGYLYEGCDDIIPIFTAGKQRCVDSAEEFGKGFFNDDEEKYESNTRIIKLDETKRMGADTLTTSISCKKYIRRGEYFKHPFIGRYMVSEAKRLNSLSPGFNLNAKDVYALTIYCAFELNAVGESRVCDALSLNTFVELEYFRDAELWYEKAAHPMSFALGSVYVDAMLRLFEGKETKQNLFFSFTHDTDLLHFMNALGLLEYQKEDLSTRNMDFTRFFKTSELVPMGARIVVERYTINNEKYIRVLVNDAVLPIPECQNGPFFTCKLSKLRDIVDEKIQSCNFVEKCRITEERPKELTFYWDWEERIAA